jgi:transcriptional regulator with XRE-family HTH domain
MLDINLFSRENFIGKMEGLPMDTREISLELKRLRKQKRLSQKALSGKCGISRASIIAIERGASDMSLSTLLEILNALGMDLKMVPKAVEAGRVAGRFPNLDELKKMRLAGEL